MTLDSQWLCYLLAFLFVSSCIAVGLIVYYVGVSPSHETSPEPVPEPEPQATKVTDVRLPVHLEPVNYKLQVQTQKY